MSTDVSWNAWPESLRELDQQACLYPDEADALRSWAATGVSTPPGAWDAPAAWSSLQRLLEPVRRVFAQCGSQSPNNPDEYACCVLLLREMFLRDAPLWAWTDASWLDIVGRTGQAFAATHQCGRRYPYAQPAAVRRWLLHCAYLLAAVPVYTLTAKTEPLAAASLYFGPEALPAAVSAVQTELQRGGWVPARSNSVVAACLARVLLHHRSPHLEKLTFSGLEQLFHSEAGDPALRRACVLVSKALHAMGLLPQSLVPVTNRIPVRQGQSDSVPAAWQEFIDRWAAVAACGEGSRGSVKHSAARAARWSAAQPDAPGPAQWTKETARRYVAALQRAKQGEWSHPRLAGRSRLVNRDLKPSYKAQMLNSLRRFFFDCQDWGWIPEHFGPRHYLATPRSVLSQCEFKPRVIDEEIWGRLLTAALSLTPADLEGDVHAPVRGGVRKCGMRYPFALVRAVAVTWLLAGLRNNELRRLTVGCVRQLPARKGYSAWLETGTVPGVCYLRVPAHKTGRAFYKAVAQAVGDVTAAWEQVRPACPPERDHKTGEPVHLLFKWRGTVVSRDYINDRLIPMLCRKAGVPTHDADGPITSHRARATIVTQMFLSGQVGLLDLQKWLGHRSLRSTLRYVDVPEELLLDAFVKANARVIQQATDTAAGEASGPETAASAGTSRGQVLAAIYALQQLCAAGVLSEADFRNVQAHIGALQQLAQRLPPDTPGDASP